jgi:alcohol dehydrogenase class IV
MNYYNNIFNSPQRYSHYSPTRIISYDGAREMLTSICQPKSTALVYDRFLEGSEYIEELKKLLEPSLVVVVNHEPAFSDFREFQSGFLNQIDSIIAIGGGAAIDFAKLLLVHEATNGFTTDINENVAILNNRIQLISVPTTCGSGSETSRYCVVFNQAGNKYSYRHWGLAPSIAILDSWFIRYSPLKPIYASAFDSFLHNLEPFFLTGECDDRTRKLCLIYASEITDILKTKMSELNVNDFQRLMEVSAMGGINIANYRTGLVHTFAEAFVSIVKLSHPHSLSLFFESVFSLLDNYFNDKLRELNYSDSGLTLAGFRKFWKEILDDQFATTALNVTKENQDELFELIHRDTVIFKESPVALTPEIISSIIKQSTNNK